MDTSNALYYEAKSDRIAVIGPVVRAGSGNSLLRHTKSNNTRCQTLIYKHEHTF